MNATSLRSELKEAGFQASVRGGSTVEVRTLTQHAEPLAEMIRRRGYQTEIVQGRRLSIVKAF